MRFEDRQQSADEFLMKLAESHVEKKAVTARKVPVQAQVAYAYVVETDSFPMNDPDDLMWSKAIDSAQKKKNLTIRLNVDWVKGFLQLVGSKNNRGNRLYFKRFLEGDHYMSSSLPDIDSNFIDKFMGLVKELKCMYPKESRPIQAFGGSKYPKYAERDQWPDSRHLFGVLHKLIEAWEINEDEIRCFWNQRFK